MLQRCLINRFSTSTFLTCLYFFFFNDTATTEIYTLSLHDALPISTTGETLETFAETTPTALERVLDQALAAYQDRKSTRLNSSHGYISYAVFCLKKKKKAKEKKTD